MHLQTENGNYLCWIGHYTDLRSRFREHASVLQRIENAWAYSAFTGKQYRSFGGKDNKIFIKYNPTLGLMTLGFHEGIGTK